MDWMGDDTTLTEYPSSPGHQWRRWGGAAAVLGSGLSSVLLFHGMRLSPWFDWHRHSLSRLGVGAAAGWFNASMLVQGAALTALATAWQQPGRRNRLESMALALVLLGALGVSAVAVFPQYQRPVHVVVAATYFVATPLGMMIAGLSMWRTGQPLAGLLTMAAGSAAILSITFVPSQGYAVREIIAGLFIGSWTFSTGASLFVATPEARS
jgi:hypothetical membrane protein